MTEQHPTAGTGADAEAMIDRLLDTLPDWVSALIQLNGLIAERMGVVATDLQCLHALNRDGPTTASVLAERVGLTAGSVSRMIDRLDAAGCVTRVADPKDRRKVLIEPTAEGLARANAYYAGLTARTKQDLAAFDAGQLAALLRFVESGRESTMTEVRTLRSAPAGE
jgi:DNA-binding MarR family transcriptional regulator